jgi:hypothetical protein
LEIVRILAVRLAIRAHIARIDVCDELGTPEATITSFTVMHAIRLSPVIPQKVGRAEIDLATSTEAVMRGVLEML